MEKLNQQISMFQVAEIEVIYRGKFGETDHLNSV